MPLFVVRAYWLDGCHSPRTPKLTLLREAVLDWTWALDDLDEVIDDLFEEIDFGSDRATAIVLAAFVEDHLTHFIRSRLVKDDRVHASAARPRLLDEEGQIVRPVHGGYLPRSTFIELRRGGGVTRC